MGTELQYVLNPLPALLKRNVDALNTKGDIRDSWAYSRERFFKENITTGFDWLQKSMDRMLEQYNRESVKKMMLKQEKIFKEQVKMIQVSSSLLRVHLCQCFKRKTGPEVKPLDWIDSLVQLIQPLVQPGLNEMVWSKTLIWMNP